MDEEIPDNGLEDQDVENSFLAYNNFEVIELDDNNDENEVWIDEVQASGDELKGESAQELEMCHLLNTALLRMVDEMLALVNDEISSAETNLKTLIHFSQTNTETGENKEDVKYQMSMRMLYFKSYYSSYFYDKRNQVPPMNKDALDRLRRDDFNLVDVVKMCGKSWTQKEVSALLRGVGQCVRDAKSEPLEKEINKLAIMRDQSSDVQVKKLCQKKLHECREALEDVRHSTVGELAMECRSLEQTKHWIDWDQIAACHLQRRVTSKNCELAWFHHVSPHVNVKSWSTSETEKLKSLVNELGMHAWEEISCKLGTNRTPFAVLQHWHHIQKEYSDIQLFTEEDDQDLSHLVLDMMESDITDGVINWKLVAANMRHSYFTANACRTRWNQLNSYNKGFSPFTQYEDLQILTAVSKYGPKWDLVARDLPGRVNIIVEKRYHELMESAFPWTYEEDRRLFRFLRNILPRLSPPFFTYKFYRLALVIMPSFPNRNLKSISSRMKTLIFWNNLWIRLKYAIKGEDYASIVPRAAHSFRLETWTMEEVRSTLLRTPFALDLYIRLQEKGVYGAMETVLYMLNHMELPPDVPINLGALSPLLADIRRGLFVPRPIFESRPKIGGNVYNNAISTMMEYCHFALVKYVIEGPLREKFASRLLSGYSSIQQCERLLSDECFFWFRFEEAWRHSTVRNAVIKCANTRDYFDVVSTLARLMVSSNLFVTDTSALMKVLEHDQLFKQERIILPESNLSMAKAAKIRELRFLLNLYTKTYSFYPRSLRVLPRPPASFPREKIMKHSLALRFLSDQTASQILSPAIREESLENARRIFRNTLNVSSGVATDTLPSIPALPPCYSSLVAVQSFPIARSALMYEGHAIARVLDQLVYKNKFKEPTTITGNPVPYDQNAIAPFNGTFSVETLEFHRQLINHPEIRLFKARAFSVLLWPMLLSKIKMADVIPSSDGPEQNSGEVLSENEMDSSEEEEGYLIDASKVQPVLLTPPSLKKPSKFKKSIVNKVTDEMGPLYNTMLNDMRRKLRSDVRRLFPSLSKKHSKEFFASLKSSNLLSSRATKRSSTGSQNERYPKRSKVEETKDSRTMRQSTPSSPHATSTENALLCFPLHSSVQHNYRQVSAVACFPREILPLLASGYSIESITSRCHEYTFGETVSNEVEDILPQEMDWND